MLAQEVLMSSTNEVKQLLSEYSLLPNDFIFFHKLFSLMGVELEVSYGRTVNGKKGTAYLTFLKNNQRVSLSAGQFGQCLGFIFPRYNEESKKITTLRREASSLIREKESLDGELFIFNIDMFKMLLEVVSKELLLEALEIEESEFAGNNDILGHYNRRFKLEFIGQNPLLVFIDNQFGNLSSLGTTESYSNLIGFIFRKEGESDQKLNSRMRYATKKYSDLLAEPIYFIEYSSKKLKSIMSELSTVKKVILALKTEQFASLVKKTLELLNSKLVFNIKALESKQRRDRRKKERISSFPFVDVVFSSRDQDKLTLTLVDISYLDDKEEAVYHKNVVGMLMVADDLSAVEVNRMVKNARSQLAKYYPLNPTDIVIAINSKLFEAWQNLEAKFVIKQAKQRTVIKRLDFFTSTKPTVNVEVREPGDSSHIGGTQIMVHVGYGERTERVLLDMGYVFPLVPAWSGLASRPSYADGLMPFLSTNSFGAYRNLYQLRMLLNSLSPFVVESAKKIHSQDRNDSLGEFIFLELLHRLGRDELLRVIKQTMPRYYQNNQLTNNAFWQPLIEKEKKLYGRSIYYPTILLSHAHQDHSIGSSLVADLIPRGLSPTTSSLLMADFRLSGDPLVQSQIAVKRRELPKIGSSFLVHQYPLIFFDGKGTKIQVAENIWVSSFKVDHSIPGALAFKVEVIHQGELLASIVHLGDYRNPDIFATLGEAGRLDLMFIDGTKPVRTIDRTPFITEKDVKLQFSKVIKTVNLKRELLIVDLVKNNFQRLNGMVDEALLRGRTVVVSPRIAYRCQLLELMQRSIHSSRRIKLPDLTKPNIKIWHRKMSVHSPEDRRMYVQYGAVNSDIISSNPTQYVLIREAHEKPEKLQDISTARVHWVRSKYQDYDVRARQETKHCKSLAKQRGWSMERIHASGHALLLPMNHPLSDQGVLSTMSQAHARQIAIIHTDQRGEIAKMMKGYPQLSKTNLIWRMSHPYTALDKGYNIPVYQK